MNGEFGRLTSERADLWHQSQERGTPSLPCSYLTPPGIIRGSNTGGDSVCHIWSNPARALGHPVLDSRALLHQAESSCRNVVVLQMDQVACLAIQENRHMTNKTPKNNPENKHSWRNGSSSIRGKMHTAIMAPVPFFCTDPAWISCARGDHCCALPGVLFMEIWPKTQIYISVVPCLSYCGSAQLKRFKVYCLLRTNKMTSIFDFAKQISEVLVPNRQWNEVARWKEHWAYSFERLIPSGYPNSLSHSH